MIILHFFTLKHFNMHNKEKEVEYGKAKTFFRHVSRRS